MSLGDPYLFDYIVNFLKRCEDCHIYDIINYSNVCCMCKHFYCTKCSKDMQYHGYVDETMRKYCKKCGKTCCRKVDVFLCKL